MAKGRRPLRVRWLGLDGKQKAQIAVAVSLPLLQRSGRLHSCSVPSSGAVTSPETRGVGQVTLFGSSSGCHIGVATRKGARAFTRLRGGAKEET